MNSRDLFSLTVNLKELNAGEPRCGPCPGAGKPSKTNFSVFASDTSCHPDERDENFYDRPGRPGAVKRP